MTRIAPDRAMLPISRHLARHLVLSSRMPLHLDGAPVSPGDRVDASAVALALAILSRAASREVDRGGWLDARLDHEHLAGRPAETIAVPLAKLRVDLGRASVGKLMVAFKRALNIRAGVLGDTALGEVVVFDPGVREADGRARHRISKGAKVLSYRVDATLAAVAHPHADASDDDEAAPAPFGYDPSVVAAFSCRYSALVYLRLLAWTEPGAIMPKAWRARRVRGGDMLVDIPTPQAQEALGVTGIVSASALAQQVVRPVSEDLRRVGVKFEWGWERSPVMKGPKSLRLRITDPREARAPARTRTPTAMRPPRSPRPAPSGLRALRPSPAAG